MARLTSRWEEVSEYVIETFSFLFASVLLVADPILEFLAYKAFSLYCDALLFTLSIGTVSLAAVLLVSLPLLKTVFRLYAADDYPEWRGILRSSTGGGRSGLEGVAEVVLDVGMAFLLNTSMSSSLGATCKAWSNSISNPKIIDARSISSKITSNCWAIPRAKDSPNSIN